MRMQFLFALVCLMLFSAAPTPGLAQQPDPAQPEPAWQPLAAGIAYRSFYLPGPNQVYITRLDLSNPEPLIQTSLANGVMTGGLQTVAGQVELYDQSISLVPETLGQRYHVVAAINGGFYNPDTGLLTGGMLHSGWYISHYLDRQSSGGFAWGAHRQPFLSECLVQRPAAQLLHLLDTSETIKIDGINAPPEDERLLLYTPQFGMQTPQSKHRLEILVDLSQPLGILPPGELVTGTVRLISQGTGGLPIGFDQLVISAQGAPAKAIQPRLKPGVKVGFSFDLRLLDIGCKKERPETMAGVLAGRAGGDIFLRQGQVQPLGELGEVLRNPRTAVALNDRYVFFIVVDGRRQLESLGMSMVELGLFAKLQLGASWGVAMDGGGSSTLVVAGQVVNDPNADTVLRSRPEKVPRTVADGLMMVLLEPAERSARFKPGAAVVLSEPGGANLRTGPGTNFPAMRVVPLDSRGVIQEHPLNGILAKGYHWWKVSFGDQTGWVSESVLQSGD